MAEKPVLEIEEYSENQSLSLEYIKIEKWLKKLRFRKKLFGGVCEQDVWKKISELNEMYEAALTAERIRYDALIEEQRKSGGNASYENIVDMDMAAEGS